MTDTEIKQLKTLIVSTAFYYGHQIPDQVLGMYVDDLSDLEFEAVARAIRSVRHDPKVTRFPLPAVIRDKIIPAHTDEADARTAAARIVSAVSRFGWTNADEARAYVGELGWYVVEMQGGWRSVCQELTIENTPMLQAQWRELANAGRVRQRAGTFLETPKLWPSTGTIKFIPKTPEDLQRDKLQSQLEALRKSDSQCD